MFNHSQRKTEQQAQGKNLDLWKLSGHFMDIHWPKSTKSCRKALQLLNNWIYHNKIFGQAKLRNILESIQWIRHGSARQNLDFFNKLSFWGNTFLNMFCLEFLCYFWLLINSKLIGFVLSLLDVIILGFIRCCCCGWLYLVKQ